MLIKSLAALGVAMLVCLIAGNYVVSILKWPLDRAKIDYPGTNQVVTVLFGTNRLGVFPLTPEQQASLELGTNRFVAVRVEPVTLGTNQVLSWRVDPDPALARTGAEPEHRPDQPQPGRRLFCGVPGGLLRRHGAGLALHLLLRRRFVFPALKMKERKYVYRGWASAGACSCPAWPSAISS